MKFFKKLFLISILLFSTVSIFAAPPEFPYPEDDNEQDFRNRERYRNFRGKRMIDDDRKFQPNFIKTYESGDKIFFEVFFTQPVNAASLNNDCIFVNDVPVRLEQIRFSKNNHGIEFFIMKIPQKPELVPESKPELKPEFKPGPKPGPKLDLKPEARKEPMFEPGPDMPDKMEYEKNDYSIRIQKITSLAGAVMEPIKIDNCKINSEYRYLEKDKKWKRS